MKKINLITLITLNSLCLFSCSNINNKVLDKFTLKSLYEVLSTTNYDLSYTRENADIRIVRTNDSFKFELNGTSKSYSYRDENYYYIEFNKEFESNEDVQVDIEYFIENYALKYKENYDELVFVKEEKNSVLTNEYHHIYRFKTVYSSTQLGESGFNFVINADNGMLIEKSVYGNNSSLFPSNSNIKLDNYILG